MDLTSETRLEEPAVAQPTRSRALVTILVTAALTFLTWPISTLTPSLGLDPSWGAGLHMAAKRGIPFGTQIDFTYGPWGFLNVPTLYYTATGVPAVLYTLAAHAALIGLVLHVIARRSGYAWATVLAFATATVALIEPTEIVPMLALVASVVSLSPSVSDRSKTIAVLAGTAVAAFQLLVKFNTGLLILALALILATTLSRRRVIVVVTQLIALPLMVLLFWLAAGESASALPGWVGNSVELTVGYSSAMAREIDSRWVEYPIAFGILAWLLFLIARETRGRPARVALGLWGLFIVFMFSQWKRGFVRHDAHSVTFFFSCAVFALALGFLARSRRVLLVTSSALVVVVALSLPAESNLLLVRSENSLPVITQLADGGKREDVLTGTRRDLKTVLQIDETTLALLRGLTVHVDPYETVIAWVYDLDWRPVPVFQTYSAYTPDLDRLNAGTLVRPHGPQIVLRTRPEFLVNDRNPMFESPEYMQALLCNFRELSATRNYEVLARTADRCGTAHLLSGPIDATTDVPVPSGGPGEMVFMRINIAESPLDRPRALLHKPASSPQVEFRSAQGVERFELVQATAEGPLILCVPPEAGFSADFVDIACPSTVRLLRRASASVTFYAVPIGPA